MIQKANQEELPRGNAPGLTAGPSSDGRTMLR